MNLNNLTKIVALNNGKTYPMRCLATNDNTQIDPQKLKSKVIGLYKNLLYLSRDWHHDLKPQIKNGFMKNKDVTDPEEIEKLIERGEYISREIIATYRLKKYRAMKRRYYSEGENKTLDEIFKSFNQ